MLLFDSWVCCDLHHKVVVTVTEDCRCFVLLLSGFQTKRKKSQHMSQTVIYIFLENIFWNHCSALYNINFKTRD